MNHALSQLESALSATAHPLAELEFVAEAELLQRRQLKKEQDARVERLKKQAREALMRGLVDSCKGYLAEVSEGVDGAPPPRWSY